MWLNETDERKVGQYVACGKCYYCLQKKRNIWTNRMMQEDKGAESSYFITLTYDQANIPLIDQWNWSVGTLYKKDLQLFLKRLRQNLKRYGTEESRWFKTTISYDNNWDEKKTINPKLRYFACGEYGKKGDRPHYHIIMWNLPDYFVDYDPINKVLWSELIEDTWGKGQVDIGKVEQASCHYVAKYTLDPLVSQWGLHDNRERPFAEMSRKPGIGQNYVTDEIKKYFSNNKNCYSLGEGNIKKPLGRYYTELIYTDEEIKKEMEDRKKTFAIRSADDEENRIKDGLEGWEAEKYYLRIKREQREHTENKLRKQMKSNKL